jgi:ketosteroid isomerase-like protein
MDAPTEANKAVVQRYLDMWNTGEATIADEVLAPGYVDAAHPEVTGADSVKQSLAQVRAAIPDFFITVEAMVGEGDTVAVRASIRRTIQGETTTARVAWFFGLRAGKIFELLTYTDPAL